ncbi:hypothetical protein D3C73_1285110 [compost metagenome]
MQLRSRQFGEILVGTFDAGFKGLGEPRRRDLHQVLECQTVFRFPGVPCVMKPDLRCDGDQPTIPLPVLFHLRLGLEVQRALRDDLIDLDKKDDPSFAVVRTLNDLVKVVALVFP